MSAAPEAVQAAPHADVDADPIAAGASSAAQPEQSAPALATWNKEGEAILLKLLGMCIDGLPRIAGGAVPVTQLADELLERHGGDAQAAVDSQREEALVVC